MARLWKGRTARWQALGTAIGEIQDQLEVLEEQLTRVEEKLDAPSDIQK